MLVLLLMTEVTSSSTSASSLSVTKIARPISQYSTLKETLQVNENMLVDKREQLKQTRRDQSTTVSTLKGEIDSLRSRLGTKAKDDERAKRSVLGLKEALQALESDIQAKKAEIKDTEGQLPVREGTWLQRKNVFDQEKAALNAEKGDVEAERAMHEEVVNAYRSEQSQLEYELNQLKSHIIQLEVDIEECKDRSLTSAEAYKDSRQQARQARVHEFEAEESNRQMIIRQLEASTVEVIEKNARNWAETQDLFALNPQVSSQSSLGPPPALGSPPLPSASSPSSPSFNSPAPSPIIPIAEVMSRNTEHAIAHRESQESLSPSLSFDSAKRTS